MYCPECGSSLLGSEKFCPECGFGISKYVNELGGAEERRDLIDSTTDIAESMDDPKAQADIEIHTIITSQSDSKSEWRNAELQFSDKYKVDIAAMIVGSILSLGIYYPAWLYRRAGMLESRFGTKTIDQLNPMFAIWCYIGLLISRFGLSFLDPDYNNNYLPVLIITTMCWLAYIILFYNSCFKIRSVLNRAVGSRTISPIWTLVFHAYYLQYKLNRMSSWISGESAISEIEPEKTTASENLEPTVTSNELPVFELCRNAQGSAFCLGCRKLTHKTDLYYNEKKDEYYHKGCAPTDVTLKE